MENLKNFSEQLKEGYEKLVWITDDYVYKLRKFPYKDISQIQREITILNNLPGYEKEELYGYIKKEDKYQFITKQKRLRKVNNNQETFINQLLDNYGYIKTSRGLIINNIEVFDISIDNIGIDENNNYKIIDITIKNIEDYGK